MYVSMMLATTILKISSDIYIFDIVRVYLSLLEPLINAEDYSLLNRCVTNGLKDLTTSVGKVMWK